MLALAVLCMTGCKKDNETRFTLRFTPYQMTTMKANSSVSTACTMLDVYIIDAAESDTIALHQNSTSADNFGEMSVTLQTTKTYQLLAIAHNFASPVAINGTVFAMPDEKVKQAMVANVSFTPADSLSLTVVMQRIVGMFKCRIADEIPSTVNHFEFAFNANTQWNAASNTGLNASDRINTITGMNRGTDGYVTLNTYIIADNLADTKYLDITATAVDADGAAVETRQFSQVPIKAGFITTYTGNFFITFDMGFSFVVGEWQDLESQTF